MTTAQSPAALPSRVAPAEQSFLARLNGPWHERGLQVFMGIVLAHWAEHLAQAYQVYVLHWPLPRARGVLGLWFPWLVTSEAMHYGYALIMLVGLWILRRGFVGSSSTWWMVAFWIQFWHHIEDLLLIGQYMTGHNLFGRPVPTSIIQLWVPRVELHLFYNAIVFIPMVVAMYHHMFPPETEAHHPTCTCAWHGGHLAAAI